MDKNLKYVLVVIIILAILYLLYKNSSESYSSCAKPMTQKHTERVGGSQHSKKILDVYHTTWCGYSKSFLNELKQNNEILNKNGITVNLHDCDKEVELCVKENVRGYPTVKANGKQLNGRSLNDIINAF